MKILFTKNKLPLSWLIRVVTGEDCSHVAFEFNGVQTIQSNLKGVHTMDAREFRATNTIVHEFFIEMDEVEENELWILLLKLGQGKWYDIGALLFFAWLVFLNKAFKRPIPDRNSWDSANKFLCTEIVEIMPEGLIPNYDGRDMSVVTPHKFFVSLPTENLLPACA